MEIVTVAQNSTSFMLNDSNTYNFIYLHSMNFPSPPLTNQVTKPANEPIQPSNHFVGTMICGGGGFETTR